MKHKIVIEINFVNGEERRIELNSFSIKGLLKATELANMFINSEEKKNDVPKQEGVKE